MDEILTKRQAQERANRISAFREELAQLEREGALALSEEQRQGVERRLAETLAALAERFDVDTSESQKQISWGMRIASTLGGLALCAAVFLFFYRFWGALGTATQVGILVAAPLGAVLLTDFAARRERTLYFASLAAMVAFACFVLDLNVMGSIFNLTPSPHAFLAWGAFALVLAYAYRLRLLLAAGLVCAGAWAAANFATLCGIYWAQFPARAENVMATGLIVLGVPALRPHRKIPEFPWVYRLVGLLAVFLAILLVALSGESSYLPFEPKNVERCYQLVGLAASAGVIWAGVRRRMPGIVNLGSASFVVFLYIRLHRALWDVLPKYLFFLLIGLIALGLLAAFQRIRRRREA